MTNCMTFFGQDEDFFKEKSCLNTACEIAGQPGLWKVLGGILLEQKQNITGFMSRLGDLNKIRIILTGAGSSAFIGEALASFVAKSTGIKCEAIHTTDIVSAPQTVLFADIPTLLVSFARSGNSPESMGAVQYARKVIKNLFEVAIVCDGSSKLYNITAENEKNLILVMPEGSNDKGFAMTSSVTCMLLAGFALLNYQKIDEIVHDINRLCDNAGKNFLPLSEMALNYAKKPFNRAVYLGCGAFKGLVHEGSLKMLELTNGEVNAGFDSATGFRHGPKAVINGSTLSLHCISNDPFTAKYDIDLLNELYRQKNKNMVAAICPDSVDGIQADDIIPVTSHGYGFAADLCVGINALVFFQMLAMHKSLELGITTDNPSPGGQVNRVVKGVIVYPYEG
ncbi:MAG: SIS domain-containing protein [Treponema sp.]|nr:SIS domain-containing protein [Treponema sp.]